MASSRSSAPWFLIGLLLVVVVGGLAFWLLTDDSPDREPAVIETISTAPDRREARPDVIEATEPPPPDVAPRDNTTPVERVSRVTAVTGRLLDHERKPINGAEVLALRGDTAGLGRGDHLPRIGSSTTSAADGRFVLAGVTVVDAMLVAVRGDGFAAHEAGPFALKAGDTVDVGDIIVKPGLHLEGTVRGADVRPVAGARVGLYLELPGVRPDGQAPEPVRLVLTDEDGHFAMPHVRHPGGLLLVQAEGFADRIATASEPTQPNLDVSVVMHRAVALIGRVVESQSGLPIPGADVTARPSGGATGLGSAVTDADGRFVLERLGPGTYMVMASHADYTHKASEPWDAREHEAEELVLRLKGRGSIGGVVHDAEGLPVRQFQIRVRRSESRMAFATPLGGARRLSVQDGRFVIGQLDLGWYTFEVWAKGHALTITEPLRLRQSQDLDGLVVTLNLAATLTGTVLDDTGSPVPGAVVSLEPNHEPEAAFLQGSVGSQPWLKSVRTNDAGEFRLEDVTAASFQVKVDHPTHAVLRRNDVVVAAGQAQDLGQLIVARAGSIRGFALDDAGQPVRGVRVQLGRPGNPISRQVVSQSDGGFLFDRIEPGTYVLMSYQPNLGFQRMLQDSLKYLQDKREGREPGDLFDVTPGIEVQQNVYVVN